MRTISQIQREDHVDAGEAMRRQKREAESLLAAPAGSVTLTVDQVKDLAQMAGLRVEGEVTDEDRETEITITRCPPQGVDDEGTIRHYRHIAYFEEYPEEGMCPLGPPNAAMSICKNCMMDTQICKCSECYTPPGTQSELAAPAGSVFAGKAALLGGYRCVFVGDPKQCSPYALFSTDTQAEILRRDIGSKCPTMTLAEWADQYSPNTD